MGRLTSAPSLQAEHNLYGLIGSRISGGEVRYQSSPLLLLTCCEGFLDLLHSGVVSQMGECRDQKREAENVLAQQI